jgi:hypothetical protein
MSPADAQRHWEPIVKAVSPLFPRLGNALKDGLKNRTIIQESLQTFASLVEVTAAGNAEIYQNFARRVRKA